MINATIAGRLGADPDLRYSQGGNAHMRLRVAANDRDKVDGEWKDVTTWITVVVFGARAEGLAKILSKGAPIVAAGKLLERTFEKRDGSQGHALEMPGANVEPLGGRREGGSQRTGGGPPSESGSGDSQAHEFGDEDIPF